MAQRVQEAAAESPQREATAEDAVTTHDHAASERPPVPEIKHCCVSDEHGRLPALLLEWRRGESGYRGRVVRPVLDEQLGWVVVEEWLSADLLGPA